MLLLNLGDSLPLLTQQPIEIAMTFTFTQQIESTQNEIAQLQARLDTYSKTDDYLTQSEELLHQVTDAGFEEKDLQIVRDRLQEVWDIEHSYDAASELNSANSLIVELQNKIKSLEVSLETALTQRDRATQKYTEVLKQSISSSPEVEFLDIFHELCTGDESPQELEEEVKLEVLEVRVKNFIKSFNADKTTWEDMREYIRDDGEKFLQQLTMARTKKHDRIMQWLPHALANCIQTGDSSDGGWVGKTIWKKSQDILKERTKAALATKELTIEDAYRQQQQPDWLDETVLLVDKLVRQDTTFAQNALGAKRMVTELFSKYQSYVDTIATKMFELISSSEDSEVVFMWVEDAYKAYKECQKNALVAA